MWVVREPESDIHHQVREIFSRRLEPVYPSENAQSFAMFESSRKYFAHLIWIKTRHPLDSDCFNLTITVTYFCLLLLTITYFYYLLTDYYLFFITYLLTITYFFWCSIYLLQLKAQDESDYCLDSLHRASRSD